ncbi:DUF1707 SHOCT-like domain-containing protein [Glycomyces arizonensis]|uniref:DUF1707 SHOCT-like domain-containing protein n=1 Tax=Glycomyces arizonensis TaxID=256035 RepID=UPI00040408C0|nr:DUF1707 domain-containing protein [Glycomyces arizonensis]
MSEDQGKLRISNADRDEAVALLKQALDEGRLDLSEFDSRSQAVYEAKTNAELDLIFEDLPVTRDLGRTLERTQAAAQPAAYTGERSAEEREADGQRHGAPAIAHWLIWVGTITMTVYVVSNLTSDDPEWGNFWPAFPIGILLAITIASWLSDRISRD